MSDLLPISIIPSDELSKKFNLLAGACNKLEAQFNFQTMTAGWYGDEEAILIIRFLLETPSDFSVYTEQNTGQSNTQSYPFADDVICYQVADSLQLDCIVALTETEQELLVINNTLLFSYLSTKLQKALNLIAKQKDLVEI
ncbi:hypothetical protein [Thalassotalea profundi]|nr:hypothetical protein [Thalassotalea profundi]